MKIITCTGYKGGCGKSTTAIHLATFFSDFGKTLLIDGDPNRTALSWSDRGQLPFVVVDERKSVKAISGQDYIIIDTPARPDSEDLKELADGCDLLVLPTGPNIVDLEPMLQTSTDLGGAANHRALITLVPPKPNRDGELMRAELVESGIPVFQSMIRRSMGFPKAALEGVPVRDVSESRSRIGWLDYQALGKEVQGILGNG